MQVSGKYIQITLEERLIQEINLQLIESVMKMVSLFQFLSIQIQILLQTDQL
jgi:hypothetical protein